MRYIVDFNYFPPKGTSDINIWPNGFKFIMVWMIYDGSLQSMCILYWSEIQYGLSLTEDPIGDWITVVLSGITKFFKPKSYMNDHWMVWSLTKFTFCMY